MTAPELPEPDCWAVLTPNGSKLVPPGEASGRKDAYRLYTADQMHAFYRQGMEQAAVICEELMGFEEDDPGKSAAAAIRAACAPK
jgi:hypothetical protein